MDTACEGFPTSQYCIYFTSCCNTVFSVHAKHHNNYSEQTYFSFLPDDQVMTQKLIRRRRRSSGNIHRQMSLERDAGYQRQLFNIERISNKR